MCKENPKSCTCPSRVACLYELGLEVKGKCTHIPETPKLKFQSPEVVWGQRGVRGVLVSVPNSLYGNRAHAAHGVEEGAPLLISCDRPCLLESPKQSMAKMLRLWEIQQEANHQPPQKIKKVEIKPQ